MFVSIIFRFAFCFSFRLFVFHFILSLLLLLIVDVGAFYNNRGIIPFYTHTYIKLLCSSFVLLQYEFIHVSCYYYFLFHYWNSLFSISFFFFFCCFAILFTTHKICVCKYSNCRCFIFMGCNTRTVHIFALVRATGPAMQGKNKNTEKWIKKFAKASSNDVNGFGVYSINKCNIVGCAYTIFLPSIEIMRQRCESCLFFFCCHCCTICDQVKIFIKRFTIQC